MFCWAKSALTHNPNKRKKNKNKKHLILDKAQEDLLPKNGNKGSKQINSSPVKATVNGIGNGAQLVAVNGNGKKADNHKPIAAVDKKPGSLTDPEEIDDDDGPFCGDKEFEDWQFKSVWGKDITEWAGFGQTDDSEDQIAYRKLKEPGKRSFKLFDFDLEKRVQNTIAKLREEIESLDDSLSGGTAETILFSSTTGDGSVSVSVISSPLGSEPNQKSTDLHDQMFYNDVFGDDDGGGLPNLVENEGRLDRNRMAPSGKASAMDTTNTNGAAARTNGHPEALTNLISEDDNTGDVTIIPTKPATSRIDSSIQVCLDSVFGNGRFIEEMAMSEDSEDASAQINYVNSRRNNQHHQSQNAVILENTTLKEEINQMRLLIQELQGQVKLFSSNYEKQKRQMASQNSDLAATNSRFLSMTLVAQYFDLQHTLIAGRLATVEDRCLMKETEKVEDTKKELCSKFQEDRNSHKEQIASLTKNYESEISELEEYYEGRISRAKENNDVIIADLRRIHEEDMQRLEANYRAEIDIIKLKHEEQLADQVKRAPGDILHKEIHSLQVVVEIRNQEIRDLRHDLLEAQSKIEALSQTNDQNKGLSARVEDLEAQLEKTRRDKNKIMEKFNTMETSMSQVVTENDRLHLYTEELNWRIETLKADDHVGQSMSKSAIEFGTSFSAD